MGEDDIKRRRDRDQRHGVSEVIDPAKRGKMVCPFCEGTGGKYFKPTAKPNTNVFLMCKMCVRGEINDDGTVPGEKT